MSSLRHINTAYTHTPHIHTQSRQQCTYTFAYMPNGYTAAKHFTRREMFITHSGCMYVSQFIASHNGKWPKRTIYAYFCLVCFFLLIENRALLPPYTYNAWQKITYPIHSFGDDDCLDKAFNANRRDVFSTVACGIAENCCIFLWGLKSEEFSSFFFLNLNVIWNWIFL